MVVYVKNGRSMLEFGEKINKIHDGLAEIVIRNNSMLSRMPEEERMLLSVKDVTDILVNDTVKLIEMECLINEILEMFLPEEES